MGKLNVKDIAHWKGDKKLAVSTAYDYNTAKACEIAGVDMMAVSGSFLYENIEGERLFHDDTREALRMALAGVRRGAPNTFLYSGLPYGLANIGESEAKRHCMDALRWGADAVYFSGMSLSCMKSVAAEKIPIIGHTGLVPWHAYWTGGFRAHGKTAIDAVSILEDTLRLQEAGVVAVELECVPHKVAKVIADKVDILVISMGSGNECDAQYLFSIDIFGDHDGKYPRHAVRYRDHFNDKISALREFVSDVQTDKITQKQKLIEIDDREFDKFLKEAEKNRAS